MKLSELKHALAAHPEKKLGFLLPTGSKIAPHAHITDISRNEKQFIDCGGTFRSEVSCKLQIWFSDDTEHRIEAQKLSKILGKASSFLNPEDMEVEVEYEAPFVSQFPITSIEVQDSTLLFNLGIKHTACLAEDRCMPPKRDNLVFKSLPSFSTPKCC